MSIDLHYTISSAPCRTVVMTAKASGIQLNLIDCDVINGQNRTSEFLKCAILWLGEELDLAKYEKFKEPVQILDKFLERSTWAAGDHLTVADNDLVTTVTSAEIFGFNVKPYPNVARWLAKAKKTIPGYEEINHAGCVEYKKYWDIAANKKN